MQEQNIEIKVVKKVNRDDVFRLYLEGKWWKPEDCQHIHLIDNLINNSFCFVGAFDGGKLIGMGRAISDGLSDAYIQDVIVSQQYRGLNIGKRIMQELVRFLKENRVSWVALIAAPDTKEFYNKLGFKEMPDHTPMLLENRQSEKEAYDYRVDGQGSGSRRDESIDII